MSATLLSFLFLVSPAFAQCTYQLEASWQFRASYYDLNVDGTDVWAATGYGLQLFDRSADPLRRTALIAIPGVTRAVRARDSVAYAGSGTAIYVVRKAGANLEIASSLDVGATVNDLLLADTTLFAATSSGVVPIDVTRALTPVAMTVRLSGHNVQSLARFESTLFAADGDKSVERLNATTTEPLTPLTSETFAASVSVTASRLYVSDGQQTDIFSLGDSVVRLSTMPFGATSAMQIAPNVIITAGNERRLRMLDISAIEMPVDLFSSELPVTLGTINRVGAIQTSGSKVYVAGGDSGLLTFDTSAFVTPYPVRNYVVGPKSSVVLSSTSIYTGNATGGGISEFTRSSSGALTFLRSWDPGAADLVLDTANDFLLSSSGVNLTYWTLRSTTPVVVSTATFAKPVKTAVLAGATAYALLDDGTLWSADLAEVAPTPVRIGTGTYSFLERSGQAIATAELTEEATTIVRHYASGNLSTVPAQATVAGVTTVLAVGGSSAAVFTFAGITAIDFSGATPVQIVLPQSTVSSVSDMTIAGSKLLDVGTNAVRVWNLATSKVERQFALSQPLLISAAPGVPFAGIATADGVASVSYEAASQQPALLSAIGGSEFHRKAVGSTGRLYLFDGLLIDVYDTLSGGLPHFLTSISAPGVIDLAASDSGFFTLSSTGAVAMYATSGTLVRTGALNEGNDVAPARIFTVRGAPWVAFTKNCHGTGCESWTVVFDPQSLVPTAPLSGSVTDVAIAGNKAAALFSLPNEIRYYDVNDPLHPSPDATRPAEGSPVSIATSGAEVFTLGDKLYTYAVPALTKTGERFALQPPTPATHLALDAGCAVVTGRSAAAELYAQPAWTASETLPLPSNARSIVVTNERITILTDSSIEIWSRDVRIVPARRRAAR